MSEADAAIHATALVIGEAGIVIRGPSGAGKSRLALLLLAASCAAGRFARLVGDDRILLQARHGRVVARPHPAIAGLVERRTQPIGRVPFAPACRVSLVVDLHRPEAPLPRLPADGPATAVLAGLDLPLLRLQAPADALSCLFVLEALDTA